MTESQTLTEISELGKEMMTAQHQKKVQQTFEKLWQEELYDHCIIDAN